ncbi:hypothetical protein AVEN_108309-1 [Araneus ventricosus]|uniref:Uncharacterized protein n=1 Tax=Araneus ventricosus TaxID=182803 RepID=A0A4Y2T338_ARAVE|nr:hypothetical protein AVEN_195300-1 [Araneus ventricosus]GBN93916.1 hypothetical protein AVEN_108309-1 [Araneus ventricosus]
MKRMIFLFFTRMDLSKDFSRSLKISLVIQAFLLALYLKEKGLTLAKHLGFSERPIMRGGSFSDPSSLAAKSTVNRTLLCASELFILKHGSFVR